MTRTIALLSVAFLATISVANAADKAEREGIKHGMTLYNSVGCSQCHGWAGQGGIAGPTLLTPSSVANYDTQLRSPRAVMPPYEPKVLSDQDISDIFSYVQTLPKAPDVKKIKLLQED
jgi:mono/diheme cytochrome c family protein